MSSYVGDEELTLTGDSKLIIPASEIELVKKASRAFAVCYSNNLYKTIKSHDPSLISKLQITKEYPYYFNIIIHQNQVGKIHRLIIFSEAKNNGDGLCEVRKIYHSSEHDGSILREKEAAFNKKCIKWQWSDLDVLRMYMMAISEGKKAGKAICCNSIFSSVSPKNYMHHSNGMPYA